MRSDDRALLWRYRALLRMSRTLLGMPIIRCAFGVGLDVKLAERSTSCRYIVGVQVFVHRSITLEINTFATLDWKSKRSLQLPSSKKGVVDDDCFYYFQQWFSTLH